VGVNNAEETEAGEKSGELGIASTLTLTDGFGAKGAGEFKLSVRRSCSTCYERIQSGSTPLTLKGEVKRTESS
jgi:hypothetical protein